jgi:hypothetical protein
MATTIHSSLTLATQLSQAQLQSREDHATRAPPKQGNNVTKNALGDITRCDIMRRDKNPDAQAMRRKSLGANTISSQVRVATLQGGDLCRQKRVSRHNCPDGGEALVAAK